MHRVGCSCYSLDFSSRWSSIVSIVIVYYRIIDNSGVIINFDSSSIRHIVMVHITVCEPILWHKDPVHGRDIHSYVYRETRSHRCPSVVSTTSSPVYPRWSPVVIRDPGPALIVVVKIPSAVVEGSPTPIIIWNPGIAIVSHYPVTIGSVWVEIIMNRR